jgi:recombinational DNA repair protein (RecF pathway)
LDDFMVCYINDILIFSKNKEEREWHIWFVLNTLKKVGLYVKLEKCEFCQTKMEFLKYIISKSGICMDPHKVQTIVNWFTPTSIHDIQCFFEFANFYQCFIAHYCMIVAPLTRIIQ